MKKYGEKISSEDYGLALKRGQFAHGIYILYRKEGKKLRIWYVGKSDGNLRRRIRQHATTDHHKGKWTHYSFFQIPRRAWIRDLETLFIRVVDPPGNRKMQKFIRGKKIA